MRRVALLILLCAMAVSVSACEFSASTATITSAELARGFTDGKATDVSTTFAPSDTPLHYVVTLGGAPDDTKVRTVWTIVDAGDGKYKDQKLDESVLQSGSGVLNFTLAGTAEWPAGKYKVDLFLNDKLDRTAEFLVQ